MKSVAWYQPESFPAKDDHLGGASLRISFDNLQRELGDSFTKNITGDRDIRLAVKPCQ